MVGAFSDVYGRKMVRDLILKLISISGIPDKNLIQLGGIQLPGFPFHTVFWLQCLVVSSCGILWYGFLCSLAPDMGWMLFLRFMVGGAGEGTDMA